MSNSIRAGLRVGALAATLCAAGLWGAYTVAQTAAEQAFAQAVERLRAALPPDVVLEHGAVTADPVSGRVTVADVAFGPRNQPEERLRTPQMVLEGIRPQGGGVGSLTLSNLTLSVREGGTIYQPVVVGGLRIAGLVLPETGQEFDPAAIRFDLLDVTGIAITPTTGASDPRGSIGRIAFANIGGDRPDRIEIEAVNLEIPALSVGERLMLGRLSAENLSVLRLLLTLAAGDMPMPPAGEARLSLEGLALMQGDTPLFRLGRLATAGEAVGGDLNRLRGSLEAEGFDMTLPPEVGPFSLGYQRVQAALALAVETEVSTGDYTVRQFRLALQDVGTLELSGRITGFGMNLDPRRDGRLHGFVFRYTDAGLVARALAEGAQQAGMRAEELREQIGQMSPMVFAGPAAAANAQALRAFLANPTSLTVTAAPSAPVALSDLEREVERAPDAASRLLNITVTSP
jgi:hypothetical protein